MTQESVFIEQLKNKKTQQHAFRDLITQNKQRLYWHIRRIVLNHDDADDVLQNTFIKAYRNIDNFKGDSSIYTWLYRIATNESITLLNSKAKKLNITNEELQESIVNNLEADIYFDGSEIELKLQRAIAALPEKQRLVFNMKYYDSLKYDDISEILGTSVGALKASYHHAVKKIEEFLTSD
ncbi:RNA polymerase sigma factor [Zhouia amylolytica]|uniref:RNA polymerase sigma factor n=1 Tax=Zhouia amylolytica AD3 TaxID=1286632 RepID=W2URM8_9FLAO|nr:RNA polymerase sigma factor [Zhouia amylolytica]ETN95972.1 RNA polymerase ECF-type sigma factor [Zhouia amylolytica AD3]MCQ0111260.1 RNA polymerase sigma factor [Zhouia amylolytica]